MKSLCPSNRRSGLTLIELMVVVAIIGILVALLTPILAAARGRAKRIACINDLKQAWYATQMWADDNGALLPEIASSSEYLGSISWKLTPYIDRGQVLHCPMVTLPGCNYSVNPNVMGKEAATDISRPSYVIWMADGYVDRETGACQSTFVKQPNAGVEGLGQVEYRHDNGAVFLFCDGHVEWQRKGSIVTRQWTGWDTGLPSWVW